MAAACREVWGQPLSRRGSERGQVSPAAAVVSGSAAKRPVARAHDLRRRTIDAASRQTPFAAAPDRQGQEKTWPAGRTTRSCGGYALSAQAAATHIHMRNADNSSSAG